MAVFKITTSAEGCILGATEYFGDKPKEFVSFSSNAYDNKLATLCYKEEGKQKERHYSDKCQSDLVAEDIVKQGLSAPFLSSGPLLENSNKSNEKALKFYQEVEKEVRAIGQYNVAIAVSKFYDYETERYSYDSYFVRSYNNSESFLVVTLLVEEDYRDLLQSSEVVEFVAAYKAQHEAELAEDELEKHKDKLAKDKGLEEAKSLLNGARFLSLENGIIKMLATNGQTFNIYARGDYDYHWLVVAGNEV